MPFIMWWVMVTGQPVVIVVEPNKLPTIHKPAATAEDPAGCRWAVCKA